MKRYVLCSKKGALFLCLALMFLPVRLFSASKIVVGYAGAVIHTVEKGETLYAISRRYGISVEDLCKANSMTASSIIKVGQKLTIPSGESGSAVQKSAERKNDVYTVQKGDTLYHIAKINGITVDELKKCNSLSSDSVLKVGQKLTIPLTVIDTTTASLPDLPANDPRSYSTKKGDSSLTWPVKNPEVTYTKGKASGVRLSTQKNERVCAIRAGTVMYVGNYRGYGQVVFVQSKTGHIYAYSGLGSISVKKGDYVVFGDTLGSAGTDPITGDPQIMLMVYQKSNPIDPAKAPRG